MPAEVSLAKKTRSEVSSFFFKRVNSLHDLTSFIIPHFFNYPLLSQKSADFNLFKQIVNLINTKAHLTDVGLQKNCKYKSLNELRSI